ncbi:hypothetical protein AVEN_106545-1 [Araneus ventricosus]|uniref:Uncharacterized protein n=1 Tax=Araneus ventricosus TaxID=182803 RepID=A0A4Y2Q7G1_ARAVE|nr:hypothetical protein AVEN_106545-1 [Araneus ventricosus]
MFGEEGSFLTIPTMPAVVVVFEGESEFSLSLIEELGRSRILWSLYFNGFGFRGLKARKHVSDSAVERRPVGRVHPMEFLEGKSFPAYQDKGVP